ncbi:MAG: DegT/DnrJ/EryC1/StrS family aminotransferase [Candidatus Omnitrophota bacterium]|nr:DegT/DnrJ/EryC1/StrS family aminotransferase [Candidatus Omnitrophota bacterium]
MKEKVEFRIGWSGRAFKYSEEEIASVVEAMKDADPMTQGRYLEKFESGFARYNRTPNSFAVANCTNALDLAAVLSGLKKGDEVIIPAHTFCATAIPFARRGARIVWADIDASTRVISAESVKKLMTGKTKVIVIVHLYGLMADMDEIMKMGRKNNCIVVEDCAQAIGAEYDGRKAGSIGDFGAFSFHGQKSLTTLGEGGMLTVKSDELAGKVPGLRHNGVRPFQYDREHYWMPAMSDVDMDVEGAWPYNFCINEVQCALGAKALERLDEMNNSRIKRAGRFAAALAEFPELSFQKVSPRHKHVYHLLSAKYDGRSFGKNRNDLIKMMAYEHKIKMIVQYYPLYRYPLFKKMGFGEADCPNTDDFFANMVSFPFHHWMSENDFDYMIDRTLKTLKSLRG